NQSGREGRAERDPPPGQPPAEEHPPPFEIPPQRALTDVEPGRGLVLRPTLQVAEHEGCPARVRQPAKLLIEDVAQLAPGSVVRQPGRVGMVRPFPAPPPIRLRAQFQGRSPRHAVQPARQRRLPADYVTSPEEDQERRLERVLDVSLGGKDTA